MFDTYTLHPAVKQSPATEKLWPVTSNLMEKVYSALCQEPCHFCGWVDNAVGFIFILNENIKSKTLYMKGECY